MGFGNKKATFSIVDLNYLTGYKVMLKSLLENITQPIDILVGCVLSEMPELVREIYHKFPNVRIYPIKKERYKDFPLHTIPKCIDKSIYKMEAFAIGTPLYRRIVVMDCDMLVTGNVDALFDTDEQFGSVMYNKKGKFNAGMFSIGPQYIDNFDCFKPYADAPLDIAEMTILLRYFKKHKVHDFGLAYNANKKKLRKGKIKLKNARIIHYETDKPWNKTVPRNKMYDHIWHEAYRRYFPGEPAPWA